MAGQTSAHSTQLNPPILAAVDGSASSYQAVAWAAVEAALHHRRLHILTSMAIQTGFGPGMSLAEADLEWLRKDGERILTDATRVARTAAPGEDPVITTEVTFELVIPTLIEGSAHARMLVVGTAESARSSADCSVRSAPRPRTTRTARSR
jgi:nucleotide-binding universal stress UspA family protein